MPMRCPSRVVVIGMRWCWHRRWWMVWRWVVHFIRVVFRIWWWMVRVVCTPWWCMSMAVWIPMWSSALNGGSPSICRFPVTHLKRCLGFLIVSAIHGIYVRFWLFHTSSHLVQTALLRCEVFFENKIFSNLGGFNQTWLWFVRFRWCPAWE